MFLIFDVLSSAPVDAAELARKLPVIGFLVRASPPPGWLDAFRRVLQKRGYTEGENVRIEYQIASDQVIFPRSRNASSI